MSQQADERIIKKYTNMLGEGIRNVEEMERVIRLFVKNEIFSDDNLPPQESGRFFPLSGDIRNHMYTATNKLHLSKKQLTLSNSNPKGGNFFRIIERFE